MLATLVIILTMLIANVNVHQTKNAPMVNTGTPEFADALKTIVNALLAITGTKTLILKLVHVLHNHALLDSNGTL